ncbi:hypothetical protein LXL04_008068 [Taraxacum kok-saghyz]
MVHYTDEITEVLNNLHQGPGKPLLFLLHGLNTDSKNFSKPAAFEGIEKFEIDLKTLHPILTECRVLKSKLEISMIQYANEISSEAHIEVMRKVKPEMKEYQLESTFLHHTYFYGSCRHCSYTCICATGDNSSVLHYGHAAAPNDRTLRDGDMALLDMGAEFHFYASDITCSFPVNGKFTSNQRLIYNSVLDAHDDVISTMKPGVNWVDMHKLAEKTILQSLKKGSFLSMYEWPEESDGLARKVWEICMKKRIPDTMKKALEVKQKQIDEKYEKFENMFYELQNMRES